MIDKCYCGGRIVLNTRPRKEMYHGIVFKIPAKVAMPECLACDDYYYDESAACAIDDLCQEAVDAAPQHIKDLVAESKRQQKLKSWWPKIQETRDG